MYCAIIADFVGSKKLPAEERKQLQETINTALDKMNREYKDSIESKFTLTLGDEFQGLLNTSHLAIKIAELLEIQVWPHTLRFGVGIGDIYTETGEWAIGADGPAYHLAREALSILKNQKSKNLFPIYIKTGQNDEELINIALRSLSDSFTHWTKKQREAVYKEGFTEQTREDIAKELGIDVSALGRRLKSAGYGSYSVAEVTLMTYLANQYGDLEDNKTVLKH